MKEKPCSKEEITEVISLIKTIFKVLDTIDCLKKDSKIDYNDELIELLFLYSQILKQKLRTLLEKYNE